ncbi:MAG: hypothetical protein QOH57_2490 [Mycobacterium sp.]|nr:hypothetical protein [Mycobacterium sp.]
MIDVPVLDIAVIGEGAEQFDARRVEGVTAAVFDDATATWQLHTANGNHHARVVVDTRTLHRLAPSKYNGGNEFGGCTFHSAQWDTDFDPVGNRVAVIGKRAAHVVPALAGSAVTILDCPPNWQVRRTTSRWWPRRHLARGPHTVIAPVERITRGGVDTVDGTHHEADAIIFATGSVAADNALVGAGGLNLRQAWHDGAATYFGVAMHGFPNYFMVLGPDSPVGRPHTVAEEQRSYITGYLDRMRQLGGTRIEVRRSAQRQFTERGRVTDPARAFEVSSGDLPLQIYDGPARLTADGDQHSVRVRLTGHLDPIDGKYHWQGMVFGATSEFTSRSVELAVEEVAAQARITEKTPWGSYSIAGVGTPPFATQT